MNSLLQIPECLRDRPVDPRRKLPVPFVHDTLEGEWDFTVLIGDRLADCVKNKLCSQCGKPLGYWMAFIGGPVSARTRAYSDPPMHEECAIAALRLCPHINRSQMKRAKTPTLEGTEYALNDGAILEHPQMWVLGITRGYELIQKGPGVAPLYIARSWRRRRGWLNRDDGAGLIEMSGPDLKAVLA